jgi:hypothetical protein
MSDVNVLHASDSSISHSAAPKGESSGSTLSRELSNASGFDSNLAHDKPDTTETNDARQDTIDPSLAITSTPRALCERDHELIDFLVRKAIEKCMPTSPNPSLALPGARQRFSKPQG